MAGLLKREADVEVLRQALKRATKGQGGVVVVQATPGVGKTALLREARALADELGLRVLAARGADLEREFAFGVVRQLFEPVLDDPRGSAGRLLSGVAAKAAAVFDLEVAPGQGTASVAFPPLNALYWLLAHLGV